jgi:outer membrane protein OmpA-like peptidoglycan-associated protein
MRVPSVQTKFFPARPTILVLGLVTLVSSRGIAQSNSNFKSDLLNRLKWPNSAHPAVSCSVQPSEVVVGEPVTATLTASNFNSKHSLAYVWNPSSGGGKIIGKDKIAQIETTDAAPGNYTVTAHVTDANEKKNNEASCSASFVVKPVPPKNPPTISVSAKPTSLPAGGTVTLAADCTSPDGVPVSVANWSASGGTISGTGGSATVNTTGASPGAIAVTAICIDSRGLNATASVEVEVEPTPPPPPPPSPEIKVVEARLALRSIYFPTSMPSISDPNTGLVESQQQTLIALAADFKQYLESKPEAHLLLVGHADPRGRTSYDQKLSERRVERVKSFLVEHGVSEANIDTEAYGARHALSEATVRNAIENDPQFSAEERQRALRNMQTIVLASDRRVDIRLSTTGESSVRRFPLNAADALTLIGAPEGQTPEKTFKAVSTNKRRP